jgi:hypothetical protein
VVPRTLGFTKDDNTVVKDLLLFFINVLSLRIKTHVDVTTWLTSVTRPGPGAYAAHLPISQISTWLLTTEEEVQLVQYGVWERMEDEALHDMSRAATRAMNSVIPINPITCVPTCVV